MGGKITEMRKLKLQMQMSVDGFVSGPNGELDWMTWDWDEKLKNFTMQLTNSFDTLLLGRKMTDGFIEHWTKVASAEASDEQEVGKIFVDTPKVVFSRTLIETPWPNTTVANDLVATVNQLKSAPGKDIIVYGGADFVSSLVQENLIDDYFLFTNPAAIGDGLRIFAKADSTKRLELIDATPYECGIVVNHFRPASDAG